MQRARTSSSDKFIKVLQQTCYASNAAEIADLFRKIVLSFHQNDGELTDEELGELAEVVFESIPTAHKANMVGVHTVYKLSLQDHTYRCTWRELLAKGSYNHVYYADLTTLPAENPIVQPAVVKITVEVDDFRVYVLENVIHAVLSVLPGMQHMIVPIRFPFKVPMRGVPPFALGVVLDNPGCDNMGRFIEEHMRNDDDIFSFFTTIAIMVQQGQAACRFEHRDLKADNLMLTKVQKDGILPNGSAYPMFCRGLLFIDFGMTRFEMDGEYFGCDCMHTDVAFNPCHDMQSLSCTLLEDYHEEFEKTAPLFLQYLQRLTYPLYQGLRKQHPNYENLKSSSRHKRLCTFVAKERNTSFTPQRILEDMTLYWQKKFQK
jgi:hypothetical protein